MQLDFQIPNKLIPFIASTKMYQVLYGGRSSAKSYTAVLKLIIRAMTKKTKIVCTREFQSSIDTSTYAELRTLIYKHNLHDDTLPVYFIVKSKTIICSNGSEFIFKGLARDIMQIKSIPDIDIVFVEEAETINEYLWDVLDPTIRSEGCELIICFNPREETSATYKLWIKQDLGDDVYRLEINYMDNPFNSSTILKKIERMRINDYAKYEHFYLGKVLDMSEDVIFKGRFEIKEMDIKRYPNHWMYEGRHIAPLYGMDFGFSTDPTAIVEVFILDENTIYINREIHQHKLLPSHYKETIKTEWPESLKSEFKADNSRPDTIAQLIHYGLNVIGADKGKGSVEAGIEWLQGKKIYVNPNCSNAIYEFYNYRYKTDKNSGIILTDIIDANNHCLTGDTLINTELGNIPIRDLINKTGKVWSFNEISQTAELNDYFDVRKTQEDAPIFLIELSDGRHIKATAEHPILTLRGWVKICDLTEEDFILDISKSIN